jgi:hypothetical protein
MKNIQSLIANMTLEEKAALCTEPVHGPPYPSNGSAYRK